MTDFIRGAGGDGGSSQPNVAPTTLKTKTTAKVLFLTSAGEVGGLADSVNPLKSVLFDNTPVMNADGSLNFEGVKVSQRFGTASQSYLPGYPSSSTTIGIGTKVTTSTPVVHDTLVADIDAVRVTIRFAPLFEQKSNGDEAGNTVNFRIERRLGNSGAWSLVYNITKTEKSTAPADLDYLVERPGTTGAWQVRVVRVTADNTLLTASNDIFFQAATNIQNVQLTYPGAAYIGLTVSADNTGTDYPRVAFDTYGIKVKVPNNYNVVTRVYTGNWTGTFAATRQVCDNPAWVLYEILTNTKWGMGIAEADIDVFSFYSAAQYNDQLVPDGAGGTEPRYTFNYQYMAEAQSWDFVNEMAASFGAAVYTSGNFVKLVQDRPTTRSALITNSNVIDGDFEYSSSMGRNRYTAAIVYWTDPAQGWLSVPAYYEDTAAIAIYGYNKAEVAALGATSEGQAYRYAKWLVDTSINNTDTVTFRVGLSNAGLEPGEVVDIMDTTYAEVEQEAKLVSKTTTSITLDRPVTVSSGNTFDILNSAGTAIVTRTITSTGTLSTINFSGTNFTGVAGRDVIITGAVAPRKFKVTNVREDSAGVYLITAVQYDPNKFGRVDGTFTLPPPVYTQPPSFATVPPVTGITFTEESYTTPEGQPRRWLSVRWSPPANSYITGYQVFWSRDNGDVTPLGFIEQPYARFPADVDGLYTVSITAFNARGVRSIPATGSATVNISAPVGAAALDPVTSLFIKGTAGGTFSGTDAVITWADTQTNGSSVIAGYEVRVKRADTSALLRTEFIPKTQPKEYAYTLDKNRQDGGPRRSVIFDVYVKDTFGRYSAVTSLTASNPTPAAPSVTLDTGYDLFFVKVKEAGATEPDITGCKIWVSTTSGFTPNDATNLVSNGPDRVYSTEATAGVSYYVRAAFYDAFSSDTAGLNISAQQTVVPVTFAATDPNEYDIVDITLKGNDPSTNRVSWTAGSIAKTSGDTGVGTTWSITAGDALWTSGTLYVYWQEGGTTLLTTTSLTTAIGATKRLIATYKGGTNLSTTNGDFFVDGANIYAQTIGATQLVTGSAVITGTAQISDAIITGAKIASATITDGNIANATITNAKIANLDAGKITTGTLDANRIGAESITAAKIDSRNLTIKDAAGTVIFSATTDLDAAYINPAPGWLNSNITISSGNISGIGTGNGTAVANSLIGITNTAGTITLTNAGSGSFVALTTSNPVASGNIASFFTTGAITGTYIADATIGTAKIGTAAITSALIANGAILNAKIGDAEISSAKIANLAVTSAKIDNLAVTTGKINDLAVSTLKIGDRAVTIPVGVVGQSGSLSVNVTPATAVVATATITLPSPVGGGGGVSVIFSSPVRWGVGNDTSGNAVFTLKRGTTVLRTATYSNSTGVVSERTSRSGVTNSTVDARPLTWVLFDELGPGTYTYTVEVAVERTAGATNSTVSWTQPGFVLIGSRK